MQNRLVTALLITTGLSACGGGGGSTSNTTTTVADTSLVQFSGVVANTPYAATSLSLTTTGTGTGTSTTSVINASGTNPSTLTITNIDSNKRTAVGDGTAVINIPLLSGSVNLTTFASDLDYETRATPATKDQAIVTVNGRQVEVDLNTLRFNQTAIISWSAHGADPKFTSGLTESWGTIGNLTAAGNVPTTGTSVAYTGEFRGRAHDDATGRRVRMAGNTTLDINFAAGTFTGTINNIQRADNSADLNPLTIAATITGTTFAGTVAAGAITGGTPDTQYDLSATATGQTNGNFYGANGEELGGPLAIQDATTGANWVGAFIAN